MTVRIVLQTNGRPRCFVLTQPPGYRVGTDSRPVKDTAELAALRALNATDSERPHRSRSSGARAVTV